MTVGGGGGGGDTELASLFHFYPLLLQEKATTVGK